MPPTRAGCGICGVEAKSRCGRCTAVYYCSSGHQADDWPKHKLICKQLAKSRDSASAQSATVTKPQAVEQDKIDWTYRMPHVIQPGEPGYLPPSNKRDFSALFAGNVSRLECYRRIIDIYRLWIDDCAMRYGEQRGLYAGKDPLAELKIYLRKGKQHFPKWWSEQSEEEIIKIAVSDGKYNIKYGVDEEDLVGDYGNVVVTAMRALAGAVDGRLRPQVEMLTQKDVVARLIAMGS